MTDIQDAVTLAADLQRTPLQIAAKRVYDALLDAERYLQQLHSLDTSINYVNRTMIRIDASCADIAMLMHEGDCE